MTYFTTYVDNSLINIKKELVVLNEELKQVSNNQAWIDFEYNEFRFRHYSINHMVTGHNPNKYYDVVGRYENSKFYFNQQGGSIEHLFVFVHVQNIEELFHRIANSVPVRTYLNNLKGNS